MDPRAGVAAVPDTEDRLGYAEEDYSLAPLYFGGAKSRLVCSCIVATYLDYACGHWFCLSMGMGT